MLLADKGMAQDLWHKRAINSSFMWQLHLQHR